MDDLPPGFRFYPREEELISFYLLKKLEGKGPQFDHVIPVIDIYKYNPSILRRIYSRDYEEQWFFFIPMQEKEGRGCKPNRLTKEGYWKATGSPGYVFSSSNNRIIGVKRTMVFYIGRAPNGTKTHWKMNEYKAIIHEGHQASTSSNATPKLRDELSLCRVYVKSKCARSFDRRPLGIQIVEGAARQPLHVREAISHELISNPTAEINISPRDNNNNNSSSSGDYENDNIISQTMESTIINWDLDNMVVDNEPWWDFQQVNLD